MKIQNKFSTGFTLIEILVVVSIIGFLITIVLVSLNSAKERAKETAGIQQLKQVKNAINMFYSDNGYYPETQKGDNSLENLLTGINSDNKVYIPEITDNPQLMYFGINCDSLTKKCSEYSLILWDLKYSSRGTWSDGIDYCNVRGKRLATVDELKKQIVLGKPAISNYMIPWSLNENPNDNSKAYVVDISGTSISERKINPRPYIHCVRE